MNGPADLASLGLGLLVARVVVGLLMAAHGSQKLFGWFGGYGLKVTGEFFTQLGFPAGVTFATLAAVAEITSGLLVALGLLGPVGPALMISVMIVAAITVHWEHGVFFHDDIARKRETHGKGVAVDALNRAEWHEQHVWPDNATLDRDQAACCVVLADVA